MLLKLAFKRDEHRKFRASLMAHRGALGDEHVARGENTSISLALMAHSTGASLPQHVWAGASHANLATCTDGYSAYPGNPGK